jgi:regulatory protein
VRFADGFAETAVRSRGLARRVVQGELRRKGIDAELAARAATMSPEDEMSNARTIAAKRLRALRGLPPEARTRRLVAFLARRGYGAEVCSAVVAELVEGVNEPD